MPSYRLFLRNASHDIVGRTDFEAEDGLSALRVTHRIAMDCSDYCNSYDLLEEGKPISASNLSGLTHGFLSEIEQQIVIDREIALRDSLWRIRESKRLLAAIEGSDETGRYDLSRA